jgi:predicted nucleic acid-binding protein
VAIAVFDADVLIGYLDAADAQHDEAESRVRDTVRGGLAPVLSALTYAEVMVGPARLGRDGELDRALEDLGFAVIETNRDLARDAARVRASAGLGLADAFVAATAHQMARGGKRVVVETFDTRLRRHIAGVDDLELGL